MMLLVGAVVLVFGGNIFLRPLFGRIGEWINPDVAEFVSAPTPERRSPVRQEQDPSDRLGDQMRLEEQQLIRAQAQTLAELNSQ